MKRIFAALTILLAGCVAFGASAQSWDQDPKWGDSPEQREHNVLIFNYLQDAYNIKNYDEAVKYLQELMQNAPRGSQNTYIWGINIYKYKANAATSVSDKNMYIDSMVLLYDMRADNFPDRRADVLKFKAADYLSNRPTDRENIHKFFREAVEAQVEAGKVDANFLNIYFMELTEDFKIDMVDMEAYLDAYDYLDPVMKANADTDQLNTFEALFVGSGAANCENIEKMYARRIEETPDDVNILLKAVALLERANCSGPFFIRVAELYYQVEPSSESAIVIARAYQANGDNAKAMEYLNLAIQQETDPVKKVNLTTEIAASHYQAGNYRASADAARQALQIDPKNGLAYYFLAQSYNSGTDGCSGFNKQAAFWLVYDTLAQARRNLGPDSQNLIPGIDSQMASLRANFPSKEECFFRGLTEGQAYTVSCGWVSGRTTVREGR